LVGRGAFNGFLLSAVMDNTVKSAVFFCFKESTYYPRYLVGELTADVQGFILKAVRVISDSMIVELSDRFFQAVFFL